MDKTKKITIACVNTALHEVGGETRRLRNLYLNINSSEYRFFIVYCSRQKEAVEKFFLEGGVKPEDLFYFPTSKRALFIPLVLRLRNLYITEKVDIMHSFFLHSDILGFVSALLAGIQLKISNVEGKFVLDEKYGVGKIKQTFYAFINRVIRPHFYKTVTVSEGLKDELEHDYGVCKDKLEVINIGIEVPSQEMILVDSAKNNEGAEKIIANAARFSKDKGLEYFVRSVPKVVKEVPEARFVLAGAGEEEVRLKQLAVDLGVESKISFPGWTKDMNKFMRDMDVFALTSIREGCPMTLMEALSFAKPAVAFDVPGPQEMINDGEDGLLVEPFNVEKFSLAIIKVCKGRECAEMLGKNGRRKAEEKFSVEIEAKKMKSLYASALFREEE